MGTQERYPDVARVRLGRIKTGNRFDGNEEKRRLCKFCVEEVETARQECLGSCLYMLAHEAFPR